MTQLPVYSRFGSEQPTAIIVWTR